MLRQDLLESQRQLEILRKAHEELQESHSSLRQEMINIRKNNLDNRFASQNTLVTEESNVTILKEQIEQLRAENLNLSRTSEQHIQLLKVKMNNQRSEYSAKVYELEQKLKGKKEETRREAFSTSTICYHAVKD
jgi:post-segregation antitoxin (ccd killing protein)